MCTLQPVPESTLEAVRAAMHPALFGEPSPLDAVSTAAQEAKRPQRDMPIGIIGSLAVCTVLYVLMSLVLTGLAPYFGEQLFTSQMVKRGKPAPDLFLYAAEKMRADPARTLVVEDSVSGVSAGKAAGMTVWGFIGGSHYQSRDGRTLLHNAGADRVFERMADFWPNQPEQFDGRA